MTTNKQRGIRNYYYGHQLRNYLAQFMAIFAGMQVQTGWRDDNQPKMLSTPVMHASKDRVVGFLQSEFTQNKPVRLPLMSAHISAVEQMPERRKGTPNVRRNTFLETGRQFPDDVRTVEQRMPVPYNTTMELSIWASNQQQHYQLLEQILMVFNPLLQIQATDEPFDWTKITTVELQSISPEENVPAGTDRRLIRTTLSFSVPVYISAPAELHDKFVQDIYIRVGAVGKSAQTSYDVIAALDEQGIEYEEAFTLDNIDLDDS